MHGNSAGSFQEKARALLALSAECCKLVSFKHFMPSRLAYIELFLISRNANRPCLYTPAGDALLALLRPSLARPASSSSFRSWM